ncbi:MAG: photosystem I core protein PsaA, partial [Synechococcaceae bacterium WB9_3_282]|nr:photosystem I core protein PsaA [Synechococcaceae bacterium WB9_3_282]
MTISPPERGSKAKAMVDRNPVPVDFDTLGKPGHFDRALAKGPKTTTWIWNLHSRAHDFDSHTSDLEEVSRKIFSAHFGHLAVIFIWLSGAFFHGARFSNYSGWLADPLHVKPSAQVVWPIFGQEILNGDMGAGFHGIQMTSGLFHVWRAWGFTNETQLLATAIGALVMAGLMLNAGVFHYHKAAPKLEWFQNVESMLNHHLAGLLGLGSLSWTGHLIHVSLPTTLLMDAIDAGQPLSLDGKTIASVADIPLPHAFLNQDLLGQLYPGI